MKKTECILLCLLILFLVGCERSLQTDIVLFCKAFNAKSESLILHEENAFRRTDTEYLLYAGNILLRLQTNDAQAVHTVVLSADPKQLETLQNAADCAFAVLAEPYAETPPEAFLAQIHTGKTDVVQTETEHFIYLLFRSSEQITVQQINQHLCELPSMPELHSEGTQTSPAAHASQSR